MFKNWFTQRNLLGALATLAFLLAAMSLAVGLVSATPGSAASEPQIGAPAIISYQGQVMVSGTPFSGNGYFKFAIVNTVGDTTYWSNNGTSTGGSEPTQGVVLPVSNGLFNVLLGDTALDNMTQGLSAAAFNGTQRYLRVWFSSDGTVYQKLGADQRIASVPFALQAVNADTVDGQQASAFAQASHTHAPGDADTVDGQHAADLALPAGAMVLGQGANDTTLIAAGFSSTGLTVEADDWVVKAAMPTGRQLLAAAAVDGIIYAIGGSSELEDYEQTNEAYDPVTNSWSTKAPLPTGRTQLAAAAVDGIIYVLGGTVNGSNPVPTNEAYNPTTNSWSTKAAMPTARQMFAVATADGIIYAIGGSDGTGNDNRNEAYDPASNSWSPKAALPTGRQMLAAAAVDGIIYAIGGLEGISPSDANEAYDPGTNSWGGRAALPATRYLLAAVTVDDVLYAIGGRGQSSLKNNEAYDPDNHSWSTKAAMPTSRQSLAAAVVDDVIYVLGGDGGSNSFQQANEAYYPVLQVYIKE